MVVPLTPRSKNWTPFFESDKNDPKTICQSSFYKWKMAFFESDKSEVWVKLHIR